VRSVPDKCRVPRLRAVSAPAARPRAVLFEEVFCQQVEGACCGFGSKVLPRVSNAEGFILQPAEFMV